MKRLICFLIGHSWMQAPPFRGRIGGFDETGRLQLSEERDLCEVRFCTRCHRVETTDIQHPAPSTRPSIISALMEDPE